MGATWLAFAIALSTALSAEPAKTPVPKSPYIAVVYRFADTMLEHGRDTYGSAKTGLFLSALDRNTLAPLTNRPPAPKGVREDARASNKQGQLTGANPQHDQNLLRLLYTLSVLTTKPKYRQAADAELKWFLETSARTPFLPWSDHIVWDTFADTLIAKTESSSGGVESFRPWMLWDRAFIVEPAGSHTLAESYWKHLIKQNWTMSRRQAGFYIRSWASAFAHTRDDRFLHPIGPMLRTLESKERSSDTIPFSSLNCAIDCAGAARLVPEPLASRLDSVATKFDDQFCSLLHNLKSTSGFIHSSAKTSSNTGHTALWRTGPDMPTTAQVGMMCVARYDNGAQVNYRNLIIAAADAYLHSLPDKDSDVWPATLGHAISLELAAWRHTSRPVYFERARSLGDWAIEQFWGTNALPRASLKTEHYESITGSDTLALALLELHLQVLHITAVRCPLNTIDR